MIKYILFSLLILSGCASNPTSFPTPPELLTRKPEAKMHHLPNDVSLSEATKIIVENYNVANQWKVQLESLQEWILEQQKLSEKKDNQ